jgi:hypothetical protein
VNHAVIYSECGVQTPHSTFAPSSMSMALRTAYKNAPNRDMGDIYDGSALEPVSET